MKSPLPLRILVPLLATFAGAVFILLVLFVTELGLSVRERLLGLSEGLALAYALGVGGLALFIAFLVLRLFRPSSPRPGVGDAAGEISEAAQLERLGERLETAREAGADISAVETELAELKRRREVPVVHLAIFGSVSTGKTSLVRALIPGIEPEISVRAGTTRELVRYEWCFDEGPDLIVTDMPGTGEPEAGDATETRGGGERGRVAGEEAQRAHGVLYVAEGDLTRDQWRGIEYLASQGKPMIVVINKADLWSARDRRLIGARVRERLDASGFHDVPIAVSASGGREEVIRIDASGEERVEERIRQADLTDLHTALRVMLASISPDDAGGTAFISLIASKLDDAERQHRRSESRRIVESSTRKAVVGALAAVTPGTDLLVQGYLGYDMVRALCALHGVRVRRIEITRLLEQANAQARTRLPLVLAIAGNAMKSFPGAGTLFGGVTHAIAYGLIFDTLGRSVALTLESQGRLPIDHTLHRFEVNIDDDLEARAESVAALARDRLDGNSAGPGGAVGPRNEGSRIDGPRIDGSGNGGSGSGGSRSH
ncbi:MAG: GTPase [Gammaproteobacteria bacterium]